MLPRKSGVGMQTAGLNLMVVLQIPDPLELYKAKGGYRAGMASVVFVCVCIEIVNVFSVFIVVMIISIRAIAGGGGIFASTAFTLIVASTSGSDAAPPAREFCIFGTC